jgi:hypothetical protein
MVQPNIPCDKLNVFLEIRDSLTNFFKELKMHPGLRVLENLYLHVHLCKEKA